jgi:P4 family phage/plasmid primase-like protien
MEDRRTLASEMLKEAGIEVGKLYAPKGQAEIFNQLQPLFYDRAGCWWLWNEILFKWEMVDEVDILNMIEKYTGKDVITPKERTIILNSLKQEGRKHIPKNIKPTWIQFKDIIFDISSGKKIKATSEYFVTNPIPWEMHSENIEITPTMDKIFEEWVGKDYIRILYEIIAYCLIPDYPIHRLFCFIGAGLNGKSCFLRLLKKFIGEENITSTELDTLLTSRFEVTRLFKKLVCLMGETNFEEISHTSIIKKLTGQDMIGYEYKNKTPFNDLNYAKIIIATNSLPTTSDKTIGFYRRWTIIDFPNTFSEEKDILNDIPEEEYSCLALKCCSILHDLLKARKFTNEGTIEERTKKYEDKSNFLEKFLKEMTEEELNGFITKRDFYKQFSLWCKSNRHREMSETGLGLAMKEIGIESSMKYFNWMNDGKGGNARVWFGLTWKT